MAPEGAAPILTAASVCVVYVVCLLLCVLFMWFAKFTVKITGGDFEQFNY